MGMRGSGKSTLGKHLIQQRNRILIYDTLGEYQKFGVVVQDLNELAKFWYGKTEQPFKIVYQPLDPHGDFPIICDLVFACGDMCFYVEEVDTFLSSNPSGLDREFLNIVQRGRHKNIEMIAITQRPYAMPPILRSQTGVFYNFRQNEERDIKYLSMIYGKRAEEIRNLQTFEYLKEENGQIEQGKTTLII